MIDEKKIKEAASKYNGSEPNDLLSLERWASFQDGAEWAQQEFIKTLWHDASEEPKDDTDIIVSRHSKYAMIHYSAGGNWGSYIELVSVERWAYLDDILPKEGGEQ